jgi:hypothetical protein
MVDNATTIKAPIPEHITMEQLPSGLLFSYRWFSPAYVGLVFFAVVWDSFLMFWYSIAMSQDAPVMMLLFPIIHILVGIGLTYIALTEIFNKTVVLVGEGKLSIRHDPLPWPGNRVLQATDLTQLYSQERLVRTRNGTQVKYQLNAITRDNKKIALMSNLTAPDQVRFLEHKLEEYLGIQDVPVEGELPR